MFRPTVKEVCDAARNGNLKLVQRLIARRGDINGVRADFYNYTPLLYACINDRVEVAIYLADHPKTNVNAQTSDGFTALIQAAIHNNVAIVKHLLSKPNIQVNNQDKDGYTALHYSCFRDNREIAELLLQHPEIDVSVKDKNGNTALDHALQRNSNVVALFVDFLNKHSDSANISIAEVLLFHATKDGNVELVQHLIRSTPDLNVNVICPIALAGIGGYSALHCCTVNTVGRYHGENSKMIMELLLDHPKMDVFTQDKDGKTVYDWAVQNNQSDLKKRLLDHIHGGFDRTDLLRPELQLLLASKEGNLEKIKQLFRETPLLNINVLCSNSQPTRMGYTALHYCSHYNHRDLAAYLLNHRMIDVSIQDYSGKTALDVAVEWNHLAVHELIMSNMNGGYVSQINHPTEDAPLTSPASDDLILVSVNHDNNDFDATDLSFEEAQLLQASKGGHVQQLQQLLHNMPDLNINVVCSPNQFHALHFACKHGHHLVVKQLCNHPNIVVNTQDVNGRTPLHWACCRDHLECLKVLMSHRDTEYNLPDNEGQSALEVPRENSQVQQYLSQETAMSVAQRKFWSAVEAGHSQEVKHMVDGGDISDVNFQHPVTGMTALHVACRHGDMRLVRFLLSQKSLNLGVQDVHGQTALHEACRWTDNEYIVTDLLFKMSSEEVNLEDCDGCTAFQVALVLENSAAVDELLDCDNLDAHQALLQTCIYPRPKVTLLKAFAKKLMLGLVAKLGKHGLVDSNSKDLLGSSVTDHVLALLDDGAFSRKCLKDILDSSDTNNPDDILQ